MYGKLCGPCNRLMSLTGFPDANVCVAESTIPGAGRGLFARRGFAVGDHIAEYGGMLVDSVPAVTDWTTMISATCFLDGNPDLYGELIRSAAKGVLGAPQDPLLRVGLGQFANSPVDKTTSAPKERRKRKGKRRNKLKEAPPLPINARLVVNTKDRCVRLEATKSIREWDEIVISYLRTRARCRSAAAAAAPPPPPPPPDAAASAASALVDLARPSKRQRKE